MIDIKLNTEDKILNADYREDARWTVYVHISPSNKCYVGITSQKPVSQRWRNGKGYIKNQYFYRSIEKYGWSNFQHNIIAENLTKHEACEFEKTLIKELKSNDYHFGYNICSGGESGKHGVPTSKLQKEVTSKRLKELWQDEEYRTREVQKLRDLHNDEWRKNQSEKTKEKWKDPIYREAHSGTNHHSYGITREKLYGSDNYNAKKIVCLNTNEIFDSMVEAELKYGLYKGGIGDVCNKRRSHCGIDKDGLKMVWCFYSEFETMSLEEKDLLIKNANKKNYDITKFVVNLDTKQLFSTQTSGAKHCGINSPCNIGQACRNNTKSGGYYWSFYLDYLKENNLTDEEARKSLIFIE